MLVLRRGRLTMENRRVSADMPYVCRGFTGRQKGLPQKAMFGYNKAGTILLASLGVFVGLLFAAWARGHIMQRPALSRAAAVLESLRADLDPEHLTFGDLNRLLGSPGQYNPRESPRGASKFTWDGVVEATFAGGADAVKARSTPISLGIDDDKFAGSVRGVPMGCSTADLYKVAERFGVPPEFVSSSFHIQVAPSWEVAGALEGGRVVGWLSARHR